MLISGFASAGTTAGTSTLSAQHRSIGGPTITTVSSNWAGYYIHTSKIHSVTDVRGSWIVPKIKAWCKGSAPSAVFFGIGMDDVGPVVHSYETLGTVSTCSSSGRTYQVFEEFATSSFVLGGFAPTKVSPGNVISAEIKFKSGQLFFTLTNHNTSKTFQHAYANAYSKYADRQSAEWFSTGSTSTPYLSPYGTAKFGPKYTHLSHSDEVNISGTSKAIGSHTGLIATDQYRGTILLALHGALASDKRSFVVTWKHL
jgi:hypothetical protein